MTPSEHYEVATELLERVGQIDETLTITRTLIARGQVHATLAQCPDWYGDPDYADGPLNGYVSVRRVETREPTGGHL